jgi:hypothetical protein
MRMAGLHDGLHLRVIAGKNNGIRDGMAATVVHAIRPQGGVFGADVAGFGGCCQRLELWRSEH